MIPQHLTERFFETLIAGDRAAARAVVAEASARGLSPEDILGELFWPTYENLEKLHKRDQLSALSHHMATRLLRMLVDQNSARIRQAPANGRTVLAFCGPSEGEEMGAQMGVDMLEAHGFNVRFAGGGVANDEIMAEVNQCKPDVLLMFASAPSDLPNIRALIDQIREIGAASSVQIAVGGGVFNRADGLAEEIGADVWASTPLEMAQTLIEEPARRADAAQRTVGKNRRIRNAA